MVLLRRRPCVSCLMVSWMARYRESAKAKVKVWSSVQDADSGVAVVVFKNRWLVPAWQRSRSRPSNRRHRERCLLDGIPEIRNQDCRPQSARGARWWARVVMTNEFSLAYSLEEKKQLFAEINLLRRSVATYPSPSRSPSLHAHRTSSLFSHHRSSPIPSLAVGTLTQHYCLHPPCRKHCCDWHGRN